MFENREKSLLLEKEIRKRTRLGQSLEKIVWALFQGLGRRKRLSLVEKEALVSFCINTQSYFLALSLFEKWISKSEVFPLAHLIEILNMEVKKPQKDLLEALFDAAHENQLQLQMTLSRVWDDYDPRFKKYREEAYKKRENLLKHRKSLFMDKLQMFRSQNMFKEEAEILKQASEIFPEDLEILEYIKDFKIRWSNEILSESYSKKQEVDLNFYEIFSLEEEKTFEWIKKQVFQKAKKEQRLAYDFSFLFLFMKKHKEAFEMLSLLPPSFEKDLYSVELLLKDARYFQSLETLDQIQKRYPSHIEMPLAVTYLKAQAFKGLGHVSKALQLLQELAKFRPDYRLTDFLIEEWGA